MPLFDGFCVKSKVKLDRWLCFVSPFSFSKRNMAGATLFERAQALSNTNREEGISLLNQIVREQEVAENDEELIRIKEQGIMQLGELYKQEGKAKELADLIKVTRPFLSLISKAKAAKLVRSLVDMFLDMEAGTGIEVSA